MHKHPSEKPDSRRDATITVPRDAKPERGRGPTMPAPNGPAQRDEDYTDQEKPLLPDSPEAKALQRHPPPGKEQLRTGTAGDAARPTKTGIHGKPIPPRGHL